MKCSFGISDFLEEISSLSHSVVFLYFFALIAEEGFLSLLAILWNSAFRCLYLSFSVLYRAHLCMKCSFGISDFLEEIPSLSHSVVLLYFFALIAEEGFLPLLAILWNSAFTCLYLSFSPLLFNSLRFTAGGATPPP